MIGPSSPSRSITNADATGALPRGVARERVVGVHRALVRSEAGLSLREVACTAPGAHEVVLEVQLAGLCRTDVAVADGVIQVATPRVIGHECVGMVVEHGTEVRGLALGSTVAPVPLIGCGLCATCLAAAPCERWRCRDARMLGVDLDGAFAERVVVPAACLVRVPDGADPRRAALVEPVAAATAILAHVPQGARVGVTGEGRIAELTRRVLAHIGVEVRAGDGLDVVIETGGDSAGLEAALRRARSGALVVLKARPSRALPLDVAAVVRRELRLVGAAYGDFEAAMTLALDPRFPVEDLLGPTFGLDQFDLARAAGEAQKVFFAPNACAG
jgi:threonine dehydrogenase-like Zn-dependent dehydrogenase